MKRYPFDCITQLVFVKEEDLLPADVILVPGGSHTKPMKIACDLYKSGLAPYILPSGGNNPKLTITEWEFQRDIGLSLGIPKEAILREDQAKNTFDNARNSWQVLKEHNIMVTRAIIVCKSFFSRRALMTYQTVFPSNIVFQVKQDDFRISKNNWFLNDQGIKYVLTEAEKITKYFGHHIPNWVKQLS
ncbi:YdcF family protein [Paenibacillus sp. NPDC058910]|uniref:YdcF family protein n=1 Tax=unclassified Paenibacillus TaxID=185978 RepID=UPI00368FBAED